jgi:hypothetical protein
MLSDYQPQARQARTCVCLRKYFRLMPALCRFGFQFHMFTGRCTERQFHVISKPHGTHLFDSHRCMHAIYHAVQTGV